MVDLFAGPGGLGEGFARFTPVRGGKSPFHIVFSAENSLPAVKTLRLRTFYRLCREAGAIPNSYYEYLRGEVGKPYDRQTEDLWREVSSEVRPVELGTTGGNELLNEGLRKHICPENDDWVLIGGPPCQAYSLVGRSRNRGIQGYRPEADARHFLYREYLNILKEYRPAVFIMENVKGILSSRVGNKWIFPQILKDLSSPSDGAGVRYRIHSLVTGDSFQYGDEPGDIDPRSFIMRSEDYGIPQARHRVILLGIRDDGPETPVPGRMLRSSACMTLRHALHGLPELRSGLSRHERGVDYWRSEVHNAVMSAIDGGMDRKTMEKMLSGLREIERREFPYDRGGQFVAMPRSTSLCSSAKGAEFLSKVQSVELQGVPNHYARGHMPMDLARYLFAAKYAEIGQSPKASNFPKSLAPKHKNWNSGHFSDRFRVQLWDSPSSTIVSHISKDGHYFIHPDPSQCRSFTVREAARVQTFPDDYFFEGNRTEQYVQVGNAVPPMLAEKIAEIVFKSIR